MIEHLKDQRASPRHPKRKSHKNFYKQTHARDREAFPMRNCCLWSFVRGFIFLAPLPSSLSQKGCAPSFNRNVPKPCFLHHQPQKRNKKTRYCSNCNAKFFRAFHLSRHAKMSNWGETKMECKNRMNKPPASSFVGIVGSSG